MHVIKKKGQAEYYLAAHFKKYSITNVGSAYQVIGTYCDDSFETIGSFTNEDAAVAALGYIVSRIADGGGTTVIIIDDL